MKLLIVLLINFIILLNFKINAYPNININKLIYTNKSNKVKLLYDYYDHQFYLTTNEWNNNQYNSDQYETIMIASYNDDVNIDGWGKLNITSVISGTDDGSGIVSDSDLGYFAGFIESTLTAERINQFWVNFASAEFKNQNHTPSDKLIEFISNQIKFVRDSIEKHGESSEYWYSVSLIMAQFDGMVNGYQQSPFPPMTELELYLQTSAGDLETLVSLFPSSDNDHHYYNNQKYKQHKKMMKMINNEEKVEPSIEHQLLDCSGLIRILPDNQDILFSHVTWRYYYGMLRQVKYYYLNYSRYVYQVSFSSSPGFLSSKDDFYITGNKLAVMETTNDIFNQSLYQYVIPETVLVWQRAMIANMMAKDSKSWVDIFSLYNSGTYCNQWMVLDYKKFQPGQPLPPNSFWIAEQIPGYVEKADMTQFLNDQQYWPSYNIPFFENIYNVSGYPSVVSNENNHYAYSYEQCPRALIFKRNATMVNNYQEMKEIMQFNQYKTDPLSYLSPLNAISCRADLLNQQYGNRSGIAFGGVDSKITSFEQIQSLTYDAICGPTTEGDLPPFSWDNPLFENISHVGLPTVFNFTWITVGPSTYN